MLPDNEKQSIIQSALVLLQADPESIPWAERCGLADTIENTFKGIAPEESVDDAVALIHILANDSKWEVRKAIANILYVIPEDDFAKLVVKLSDDSNAFVRKSAERSLNRRRKTLRENKKKQQGIERIADLYERVKKQYGERAAKMAIEIAEKRYYLLAGTMVHDLRSILTPLKANGLAFHKASDNLSDALQAASQRVTDGVEFLEKFIEAMSAYSRALPLGRRPECLLDVVRSAREVAKDNLRKININPDPVSLTIDIPESFRVEIARELIVLAITHVLKNAFEAIAAKNKKFSSGAIWVSAKLHDDEVLLLIQDDGVGISAEDLKELHAFLPGRKNKSKRYSTGFGLPIAKRYVEAHGGTLSIDSSEDKGTTVAIMLPLNQDSQHDE